jgi:hypothetical protein
VTKLEAYKTVDGSTLATDGKDRWLIENKEYSTDVRAGKKIPGWLDSVGWAKYHVETTNIKVGDYVVYDGTAHRVIQVDSTTLHASDLDDCCIHAVSHDDVTKLSVYKTVDGSTLATDGKDRWLIENKGNGTNLKVGTKIPDYCKADGWEKGVKLKIDDYVVYDGTAHRVIAVDTVVVHVKNLCDGKVYYCAHAPKLEVYTSRDG